MQSAYRACHSTETALAQVQNDFQCAIYNQKAVLLLMLDLSAAFDTVDHGILLQRFAHDFGVKGCVNKWFSSYLENRSMQVFIDGAYLSKFITEYGLPQGSVIGPLGFVFYTHAVGYILRHHGTICTQMIYKCISLSTLPFLVMLSALFFICHNV